VAAGGAVGSAFRALTPAWYSPGLMPQPRTLRCAAWGRAGIASLLVVLTLLLITERRISQYATPSGEEPSYAKIVWLPAPAPPDPKMHQRPRWLVHDPPSVRFDPDHTTPVVPRSPPR
jgi:hypothetical protein